MKKSKKAQHNLDARRKAYEAFCAADKGSGKGYHRPGSMSGRK